MFIWCVCYGRWYTIIRCDKHVPVAVLVLMIHHVSKLDLLRERKVVYSVCNISYTSVADLTGRGGGGRRSRRTVSPTNRNVFNFMGFLRKSIKYIGLAPHLRGWSALTRRVLYPPLHLLLSLEEIQEFNQNSSSIMCSCSRDDSKRI